jgi:hypothetical protein
MALEQLYLSAHTYSHVSKDVLILNIREENLNWFYCKWSWKSLESNFAFFPIFVHFCAVQEVAIVPKRV